MRMLLAMMVNPFYRDPVPDYLVTVVVFIAAIISSLCLARLVEQKRIVWAQFFLVAAGVVAIAGQCLVPPWRASYDGQWMGYYAWIALPMRHSVSVEVDVVRLALQCLVTAVIIGVSFILAKVLQVDEAKNADVSPSSESVMDPDAHHIED